MAQIGKGDMQYTLYTLCFHRNTGIKSDQGKKRELTQEYNLS